MFGTDGIRGRVGTGIFVPTNILKLGAAIGAWIQEEHGSQAKCIILHDTRESASWIKQELAQGLHAVAITCMDAGMLPTPAAYHLLQAFSAHVALIISASHNPWHDNGIKIVDARFGKLSAQHESRIAELCNTTNVASSAQHLPVQTIHAEAAQIYAHAVTRLFGTNWARGIRVVLDAAHGATSSVAPEIVAACGAEVITLHNQPNGYNINDTSGALHPAQLAHAVVQHNAHIGFAFDGDGDRVIAVSRTGAVKDGDDLLCLLSQHPAYTADPALVGTIMTNAGLELYLQQQNRSLIRTHVGDKFIAQALCEHNLLLGGEPVGHILLRDKPGIGDGIVAALTLLQLLIETQQWELHTFTKFPHASVNVPIHKRYPLHEQPFATLIAEAQQQLLPGRAVIRYSGTEPILRIMVESETTQQAHQWCTLLAQRLHMITQES